jgi:hypothetical protein
MLMCPCNSYLVNRYAHAMSTWCARYIDYPVYLLKIPNCTSVHRDTKPSANNPLALADIIHTRPVAWHQRRTECSVGYQDFWSPCHGYLKSCLPGRLSNRKDSHRRSSLPLASLLSDLQTIAAIYNALMISSSSETQY